MPVFLCVAFKKVIRFKFFLLVWHRKPVPGANILTDIAPEHPVFHFITEAFRDFIFQLNGCVRNTFASVNNFFRNNGICRAGIDAFSAGTAMIRGWLIFRKFQIADDFCQKIK